MATNKSDVHISLHNSGAVNRDYSGKSGTQHIHPNVEKWEGNPDAGGKTLYKDEDGVWRYPDGTVFKGGK